MLFKIKLEKGKVKEYRGNSVLQVPIGSIVKCIRSGYNNVNAGDIIKRVNDDDYSPFITIVPKNDPKSKGVKWGRSLENYDFLHLLDKTIDDYPE